MNTLIELLLYAIFELYCFSDHRVVTGRRFPNMHKKFEYNYESSGEKYFLRDLRILMFKYIKHFIYMYVYETHDIDMHMYI